MASTKDGREIVLSRDDDERRYEARVGGELAAFSEFTPTHELVAFTHTLTEPPFAGRGVASALVAWALADVRGRGLKVLATCPFVSAYVARHRDEYADLLST